MEKRGPRRAGERTADADSANAHVGELRHRGKRSANEHVDSLGANRVDHRHDVVPGTDSWRVEAVCARLRIGREPSDRFCQIWTAHDEAFGAAGQAESRPAVINCLSRRTNTFHRQGEFEQRVRQIAGGILNGEPSDAARCRGGDVRMHGVRIGCEAAFEVRVDRQVDTIGHRSKVAQRVLEQHAVVGPAHGPRKPGARSGKSGKPKLGKKAGATEVPRIGHDEAPRLVEFAKHVDAIDMAFMSKTRSSVHRPQRKRRDILDEDPLS